MTDLRLYSESRHSDISEHLRFIEFVANLNDPEMLGHNYNEYRDYSRPTEIEQKITKDKKKGYKPGDFGVKNIPIGSNFAFLDSPALN